MDRKSPDTNDLEAGWISITNATHYKLEAYGGRIYRALSPDLVGLFIVDPFEAKTGWVNHCKSKERLGYIITPINL